MPDDARLARIRERAYLLWLDDACPEGQEEEYWQRARAAEAIERLAQVSAEVPVGLDHAGISGSETVALRSA